MSSLNSHGNNELIRKRKTFVRQNATEEESEGFTNFKGLFLVEQDQKLYRCDLDVKDF